MESRPVHPNSFLTFACRSDHLVSDRLLEVTGTISATGDNKQVLDKLRVERERGCLLSQFYQSN